MSYHIRSEAELRGLMGEPRSCVPTLTEMMSGHLDLDRAAKDRLDEVIEEDARNNRY